MGWILGLFLKELGSRYSDQIFEVFKPVYWIRYSRCNPPARRAGLQEHQERFRGPGRAGGCRRHPQEGAGQHGTVVEAFRAVFEPSEREGNK